MMRRVTELPYITVLCLIFCVADIHGGKLVKNLEKEETQSVETDKPLDLKAEAAPVENTDTVATPSSQEDHDAAVKAYDGKGAKVLPILAKLQAKYESMNDEDKGKLLEKAHLYRAKFKSAIDRIDDDTAKLFGLNRVLINTILGLDKANQQAEEIEEAVVEIVEESSEETLPTQEDYFQQQTGDEQQEDEPRDGQMDEQQDEFPPPPFFDNGDDFVPFSGSMEVVSSILGQEDSWSPEEMQRQANSFGGENVETTEENYDHLLRDYTKEFLPLPDDFNIADHLAVDPVHVEGEDQHYRQWANNLVDMAKSQNRRPESVYQDMFGIPDQVFHGGLPFDPYSYDMMDPQMYDPEYLYFLQVQAWQQQQHYLHMQGLYEDMMQQSHQGSAGAVKGYNRMNDIQSEIHPSMYHDIYS